VREAGPALVDVADRSQYGAERARFQAAGSTSLIPLFPLFALFVVAHVFGRALTGNLLAVHEYENEEVDLMELESDASAVKF
jgi:hypothetical protein